MITGQYTYTTTGGVGVLGGATYGWKIKEAVGVGGDISENLLTWATSRLGVFPAVSVPTWATPDQIEQLPRTNRMEISPEGAVNLTHRAPAGREATGRANSFVHGVLFDRETLPTLADPSTGRGLRPCELFASPQWLEPMGVEEVDAAKLSDPPGTGGGSPLQEESQRWFSTQKAARSVVLAGFEQARRSKKLLVICADEPEAGAACLWQIQTFLLPEAAWTLPFSTYESLSGSTPASIVQGIQVVVVPGDAKASAAELDAVVVDMTAPRNREEDEWVVGGTRIRVGAWSTFIMQVISAGFDDELALAMDELGPMCGHSAEAAPLWGAPAAFLLLDLDEDDDELVTGLMSQALSLVVTELPTTLVLPDAVSQKIVSRMSSMSASDLQTMAAQLQALDSRWVPGAVNPLADVLYGGYLAGLVDSPQRAASWMPQQVKLSSEALNRFVTEVTNRAIQMYNTSTVYETAMLSLWALDVCERNGIHTRDDASFLESGLRKLMDVLTSCTLYLLRTPGISFPTLPPVPRFAWNLGFSDDAVRIIRGDYVDQRGEDVAGFFEWMGASGTDFATVTIPEDLGKLADVDLATAAYWYRRWKLDQAPRDDIDQLRAAALRWGLRTCPADSLSLAGAWNECTQPKKALDEWRAAAFICELQRGTGNFYLLDMIDQILTQTPLGAAGRILACAAGEVMGSQVTQAVGVHADGWTSVLPRKNALDDKWVIDTPTYAALSRGTSNPYFSEALQRSCRKRLMALWMLQPLGPLLLDSLRVRQTPDYRSRPTGIVKAMNTTAAWTEALSSFGGYPEASKVTWEDLAGMIACRWACAPMLCLIDPFAAWLRKEDNGFDLIAQISAIPEVNRKDLEKAVDESTGAAAKLLSAAVKEQGLSKSDWLDETRSHLSSAKKALFPKEGQGLFRR